MVRGCPASGRGPGPRAFALLPSPQVPSRVVILGVVFSSPPSWKHQDRGQNAAFLFWVRKRIGQGARVPASRGLGLLFILRSLIKGATSSSPDGVSRGCQLRGRLGDRDVPYRCASSVLAQPPGVARERGVCTQRQQTAEAQTAEARLRGKVLPERFALLGFSGGRRSGTVAPLTVQR